MSLGEALLESPPKTMAEALPGSLPETRGEPPLYGGVTISQRRLVN
jgi:hypothetical protein